MIVVADTSVILNLCRVEQEHLLKELFARVLIPDEVAAECKQARSPDLAACRDYCEPGSIVRPAAAMARSAFRAASLMASSL